MVVMTFSPGFPILYVIASVFYFIHYWMYKMLILKYYKKTPEFNEDLALTSFYYIKISLLIHIFVALTMIESDENEKDKRLQTLFFVILGLYGLVLLYRVIKKIF